MFCTWVLDHNAYRATDTLTFVAEGVTKSRNNLIPKGAVINIQWSSILLKTFSTPERQVYFRADPGHHGLHLFVGCSTVVNIG